MGFLWFGDAPKEDMMNWIDGRKGKQQKERVIRIKKKKKKEGCGFG
jgi:hypothetical protein